MKSWVWDTQPNSASWRSSAPYSPNTESLDRTILGLAVENTNLKAQRLSFGSAFEEADAFGNAIAKMTPVAPAGSWRLKSLSALAVASVREIQALQAPHIAEPDDAGMTRMEMRMAISEAAARSALQMLRDLVSAESRPQFASATAALDRFMRINAEIVAFSRRNTNVRSLTLALGQKRTLSAKCEEVLSALRDALAKRSLGGTR